MNVPYVYLQIYRLFDDITPIKADCGQLCERACCSGDDSGMYLFPEEDTVYDLLKPDWITIEPSDFEYNYQKERVVPIAFCNGNCDRYQRPLACRIFPLTPYLTDDGKLEIIIDPRAKSVCPLSISLDIQDYDRLFVKNIKKAFLLLCKNKHIYSFMEQYSRYLDEYKQFFN